jgi:hypothetical protein
MDSDECEEVVEDSPAVTMLSQIQSETYQITLGDKKVQFDVRDEIFSLQAPRTSTIPSG